MTWKSQKKTIMVVDDEKYILQTVSDLLSLEGYNVVKANSGTESLKKLKKTRPDLILLDFFMPGMSGREVCEKIRANAELNDLKVAFLTVASFSLKGLKELKHMNVLDYIKKPFNNKDLTNRVKKLLRS